MSQDTPGPATFLGEDESDGKMALGCLAALVVIVGIGLAVALLVDFGGTEEKGSSTSGDLPITKVEAWDKTGTSADGPGRLLARNLEAGEDVGAVAGRSGVVSDLLAAFYEHGIEPEALERELKRRSVCYNGRPARIVPLVLAPDSAGFALSFGAPSFDAGDPMPRLEFFHGIQDDLKTIYYISLTHEPLRGFDQRTAVRILNTRRDVGRVMLEWVAEVANSACPEGVR